MKSSFYKFDLRGLGRSVMMLSAAALISLATPNSSFAQNEKEKKVGKIDDLFGSANLKIKKKLVGTADSSVSVNINLDISQENEHQLIGTIDQAPGSNVSFTLKNGSLKGRVVVPSEKKAYEYSSDASGNVFSKKVDINKVMCISFPSPTGAAAAAETPAGAVPPTSYVFNLQSLPGATAVIKLDYDGEYVVDPNWNGGQPINALPAVLSESEIFETYKLISEDFRPFQVNVTTKESVYQAAPANRRVRVIFTPTNTAAPGFGGVAYIGSFTWGTNTPCWVFNAGIKGAGEAGSHEAGHTLGLIHDGRNINGTWEEYYAGQGNWAPIMGVGYYRNVVQWSKGEYQYANNTQDDLTIITTQNGFGYRTDDVGNTRATSRLISTDASSNIVPANNYALITTKPDIDYHRFTLATQRTVYIKVDPSPSYPNLDVLVRLENSTGTVLQTSNLTDDLKGGILATLPAGTYYISVDGTGNRNPFTDGYSDYASLGEYTLSGTLNLPVGINGPSCVMPGITYTYLLNPSSQTNITSITWWANGDATVAVDPANNRYVNITFTPYNAGTVSVAVVVNYSAAPWSEQFSKSLQFGGCAAAREGLVAFTTDDDVFSENQVVDESKVLEIIVYDVARKEVYTSTTMKPSELIGANVLTNGVYIVHVMTEAGKYTQTIFTNGE